jgi:hypothetical protein
VLLLCHPANICEIDLCAGAAWSHEVNGEQDDAHYESKMNETACYVKCEKSEQPKNDKNSRNDSEHVFNRLS